MARISLSARQELLQLDQEGPLTPETVLERARSSNSALHDLFEWDDTEAARKFRLTQASTLIKRVVVRVPERRVQSRAIQVVAVPPPRLPMIPVAEPARMPMGAAEAFWNELQRLEERYSGVPGLRQPIAALRAILAKKGDVDDRPLVDANAKVATRTCLTCQKPFRSTGPGNRICGSCASGRVARATGFDD